MIKVLFISDVMENLEIVTFDPLGIMLLSAVLKENGVPVEISSTDCREINDTIKSFKPSIIAYSITSGRQKFFINLNRELKKEHEFISIFGGPHPTFFPEMIENDGVDIICIGEGEYAFLDLVKRLEGKKDISKIRNLWVKDKTGNIHKNLIRELVKNLDVFPFYDRDLLSKYSHYRAPMRILHTSVASRGCYWKCTYCFNDSFMKIYKGKGKLIRYRSVDNVINELKILKERYKAKWIHFSDSNLIAQKEWIMEFCKVYKREKIGLPWCCNIIISFMTEEIAEAMKDSECFRVTYAIETGNEVLRKKVLHRYITNNAILEGSRILKKHKIEFMVQNMLGLPTSNLEHDFETLMLNTKCRPAYSWVSICTPFPGTELYNIAIKSGDFSGDVSLIPSSYLHDSILNLPHKKYMERLQKLFPLFVNFNTPRFIMNFFVRLPLKNFYSFISLLWKGYCYYMRMWPVRIPFKAILKTIFTLITGGKVYKTYE